VRCYWGAPDSELQALLKRGEDARKALAKLGAHPTYFPAEQKWMAFTADFKQVGEFQPTVEACCYAGVEFLNARV
jgi:hypothetical protein